MNKPCLTACPECDLLVQAGPLVKGAKSLCPRCGTVLERGRPGEFGPALALHLTALMLFFLAIAFPLLRLDLRGTLQQASIPQCARILADLGWPWLAALLITTVMLAPLVHVLGMIGVLVQLQRGRTGYWTLRVYRLLEEFKGWGMAEVFVVGLLIAYVKLAQWAVAVPEPGLFALGAFMVLAVAAESSLDPRRVWDHLEAPPPDPAVPAGAGSARSAGLVACPSCRLLWPLAGPARCPRCGASLLSRKANSRQRAWALLLTSGLLYLPANGLPMMRMMHVGKLQSDTILSGIHSLARGGAWPLALVVFIASVLVPVLKLVVLTLLLLAERTGSRWRPVLRARLYRLVEGVGRWSMLDIYVVTLMVAMVEVPGLAKIDPGPGAMAFALMVIAAILAVRSLDPRLAWDALEARHA